MPEKIHRLDALKDRQQRIAGGGRTRRQFTHTYDDIISVENLLAAWQEFRRGKRSKHDVLMFQRDLIYHINALHADLKKGTYRHGGYEHFRISDPKPRDIHKASVRDRLLHHALYRILYPYFDRTFISDSYSCRKGKGTYKAINRFREYAYKVSKNHTRTCWVLKCDIRKFFTSIDQGILLDIIARFIPDERIRTLIAEVVSSFSSDIPRFNLGMRGLPLGNLTSQLLVNIYMNEFDQYVKHVLKAKHFVRYADDFVFLSRDRKYLERTLSHIKVFLKDRLNLDMHPDKVFIKSFASGVDFLGWVHFADHRVLRTATKRRLLKAMASDPSKATVESYRGLLSHGNARKLEHRARSTQHVVIE